MSQIPLPPGTTSVGGKVTSHNTRSKRRVWLLAGLVILVLVCMAGLAVLAPMVLIGGGSLRCILINCYGNPSGDAVPWPAQVAVAQQEIAKVDKSAVLHSISSSPVTYRPLNWDYTKTLRTEFRYVSPLGNDITISMQDSAPTSTVKITQRAAFDKEFYDRFALKQDEYAQKLSSVKLGPREAGELTWQGAMEHANGKKLSPMIGLNLDAPVPQWYISYADANKGVFEFWDMWFDVDARTGEILRADYKPFLQQVTAIPAP